MLDYLINILIFSVQGEKIHNVLIFQFIEVFELISIFMVAKSVENVEKKDHKF